MHVYLNCNEPKLQDGLLQKDKRETFFFNQTKNHQKDFGFGFDLDGGSRDLVDTSYSTFESRDRAI